MFKSTEPFEIEPTQWVELSTTVTSPNPLGQKQVTEHAVVQTATRAALGLEAMHSKSGGRECGTPDGFRAIAELMPVPVAVSRVANGVILYANELFAESFGISSQELIGRWEPDFYGDPGERRILLEALNRDGAVRNYEIRLKKADGTPFWAAASLQSVTFDGEPAILTTFCDITARVRSHESLRESEESYRQIVELSAEAIAILTPDKIVYINAAGALLLGADRPEALVGKSIGDFIHPDYQQEFPLHILDVGDRPQSKIPTLKSKIIRFDGQVLDIEASGVTISYQGQPAAQIVFRDITDRNRHQEAFQEAKTQLQTILEAVPGIVSWISSDLRYLGVNRHLAELYGLHPDDFVGQDIGFLGASPEFLEFVSQFFESSTTEDVREIAAEVNGFTRHYLLVAQKYDRGGAAFFVGIDITQRKQALADLRKSEAKLRAILNSSLQSILLIDREYKIQAFNQTAHKFTKIVWEKNIEEGDSIYEYIMPEDVEIFVKHFQTALQGEAVKTERNVKGIHNEDNWFEINYNPVFAERGEVSGVYFSALNINQRKKAIQELAKSEERFRSLVQNSSDAIAIIDAKGMLIYESPSVERILGYAPREIVGKNAFDYVHPEDRRTVKEAFVNAFKKANSAVKVEVRIRHANGSWVYLETVGSNLLNNCAINGFVLNSRDVTERKQQEERLRILERSIAASSNGIAITDAQQPDNPAVYVNPSFEMMTGYSAAETIGRNLRFLQGSDTNQPGLDELRSAIWQGKDCKVVLRNYHKNGQLFWNELRLSPAYNSKGTLTHFIGVQTDITDRKIVEEELIYSAFHDALTGLANRALLMDRLGCAIARSKRYADYSCTVLVLDLDRFKVINDSLGHTAGDRLLNAIARRLEACLASSPFPIKSFSSLNRERESGCSISEQPINSLVARLGGDRFVILLEGIREVSDATQLAEQIHKQLLAPFKLDGHEVFITTSIGIAFSSLGYTWQGDLLRDADLAMYHAKARGKARCAVFDKAMHDRAVAQLQLENDLRWAIERQEFQLYYQPIVCLSTGRIVGFEALVRWKHPERGTVSPTEFIPLAEETGLILPLGSWVLREACRQMRQWQQKIEGIRENFTTPNRELIISVNLSGKQFLQPDLVEQIDQILRETGLDARCLKLEITESAIVDNIESATETLLQLRARNIQLSLDDFGTGYSSLSYLHRFPINTLKIDRSFVSRMRDDGENTEIVRAIAMLAHSLGMDAIAEGVETKERAAQLKALGCEYGQGYFFSKPLSREAASLLLASPPQW